jgi:hypothetical protein
VCPRARTHAHTLAHSPPLLQEQIQAASWDHSVLLVTRVVLHWSVGADATNVSVSQLSVPTDTAERVVEFDLLKALCFLPLISDCS